MIRNLINVSDAELILTDFNGLSIGVGESADGLMFSDNALRNSADVIHAILDGRMKVSDGTYTYEGNSAVNLIKGVPDQLTRDGKRIITASDRPKDHYRHFSSSGDDVANKVRGGGPQLIFDVPPGETHTIDTAFIDDLYLKDGIVIYQNAELGSYINMDIIVPPNTPYPAIFHDGNFDLVNGHLVPNADNTGEYCMYNEEKVYLRFINRMLMLGTLRDNVTAPEPSFLPKTVFQRFSIHNGSAENNLKAVVAMGLYRMKTI